MKERIEKIIETILVDNYIHNNVKLKFWHVEQYLIRMGYHYYLDSNGNKKLAIRRTVKPFYYKIVRKLDNIKADRDITVNLLEQLIEKYKTGEIRYSFLRKFYKDNKQFLTKKDKEFYSKLINQLTNKKEKFVLGG